MAMPLSSHTTAGAGRLGTLLRSQPKGGKRTADLCRPAPWTLRAADPRRLGPIQQVRGLHRSKSGCPPWSHDRVHEGGRGMGVIIGVDPHKASCTVAVLDER